MYFNGVVNIRGAGLGVVLITLEGEMLPMAKRLDFKVTNNMAEYEAYLFRLEAAMVARAKHLMVYRDFMPEIQQALEEWEVERREVEAVHQLSQDFTFDEVLVIIKLGAPCYQGDQIIQVQMELEEKPWFYDLKKFIESREYLEETTAKERYTLRIQVRN
eukprot:XP_015576039.1 uncharacterized protein LOC107261431 [Ricinus communis]